MAPIRNARIFLKETPGTNDYPEPGKHVAYDSTPTIDIDTVALNGGFLIKVLSISIDPSIRGRIGPNGQVKPGQTLFNFAVGVVVRSENSEVKVGDHIEGILPLEEYVVKEKLQSNIPGLTLNLLDNSANIPWSVYTGVAGMPGKTSYYGWKEFANAKAGETVYVSTGAGPVGSVVIQLAKRDGLKVIASAGSEEKLAFLKELGADVVFNYKTTKTIDALKEAGGIDIYWDNVGGEMLEAALDAIKPNGRIIICGAIAGYNSGNSQPIRNLFQVIYKSVNIYGLFVFAHDNKYREEFYKTVPQWIAKGELKYTEDVTEGLEFVPEAILKQQKGLNKGKSVVKVADS